MQKKTKVVVTLYKHKNLGDVEIGDSEVQLTSHPTNATQPLPS